MLFPLRVKRIIFCFVYLENHHPSCIYPSLEEEDIHTAYIVDVDSIPIPQPVPKYGHCIEISLEFDQPCNHTEVRTDSKPVQTSAPLGITAEPCHQSINIHDQSSTFPNKIRMKMFSCPFFFILIHLTALNIYPGFLEETKF